MMTSRRIFVLVSAASLTALAACSNSSGPKPLGPPAKITLVSGGGQTALANTAITSPITVVVKDAGGRVLPNKSVSMVVVGGGGTIPINSTTTDVNGDATLPGWTLGKAALPQVVRFTADTATLAVIAQVQTQYNIVVRFWGQQMTTDQQTLFTNAAARLEGIVTGDVPDALAQNIDLSSSCGVSGQPTMNETIDDVIIYASIQPIDGPGKILAQSGPCLVRNAAPEYPAVGVMEFDSADLTALENGGSLQDVITHEMMHVLGFGVLWFDDNVVDTTNAAAPRFTGARAIQACQNVGATTTCATYVPVEGNQEPVGTRYSHWDDSTFVNELMTGYLNTGPNPLSIISIGSLADIGYTVNMLDGDAYTFPHASLRAAARARSSLLAGRNDWEHVIKPAWLLDPATGRIQRLRPQ